MGKVLTGVRSLQRKLIPDAEDWERHELTSLRGIAYKAKTNPDYRFRDLSRTIDEELLSYSFRKLNKHAASGVDRVTYSGYKGNYAANIEDLIGRLKRGGYRAKLVKRKHIPKGAGKTRPLGIPVIEDKLLQTAGSEILSAIYEQDFYPFSYGYRPRRSATQAADDLVMRMQFGRFGYVVEADIKGFFDNMSHDIVLEFLSRRIDDKAFINLIRKWLTAGILDTDGKVLCPTTGTPQGSIVSPILSNVYLHYALDKWFDEEVKPRCSGNVNLFRFADDWLCCFQYGRDADRYYKVLPKRLERFDRLANILTN